MKNQFFNWITLKFADTLQQSYSISDWNLMVMEELTFSAPVTKMFKIYLFPARKNENLTTIDESIFSSTAICYNIMSAKKKINLLSPGRN